MVARLSGVGLATGIVARDATRLVGFYRDFLGLEVVREIDTATGAHITFFGVGGAFLKVFDPPEPPPSANPSGGLAGASGLRYVTIEVLDVAGAIEGVDAAGGRVSVPMRPYGDGFLAMIEDPEGNTIELIQRQPG